MKVGIIGYGSMGSMLAQRLLGAGLVDGAELLVSNRSAEKLAPLQGICQIPENNTELAAAADIVFLAVKPGDLRGVLAEIAPALRADTLVVSLNANVLFASLEAVVRHKMAKVVPSVTAEVGKSQTLLCCNDLASEEDSAVLKKLLRCMGDVYELREEDLGMGSELVSCMPGFIAAIFDVICRTAEDHISFPKEQILRMVLRTLDATGTLMVEQGMSFEEVVRRVATPGGITEEGTKIIYEQLPGTADKMFAVTLAKRKLIADREKSRQ